MKASFLFTTGAWHRKLLSFWFACCSTSAAAWMRPSFLPLLDLVRQSSSIIRNKETKIPGITALSYVASTPLSTSNKEGLLVAGTKRGDVLQVSVRHHGGGGAAWTTKIEAIMIKASQNERAVVKVIPAPVFAIDYNGDTLFCGKGDRHVSVYTREEAGTQEWKLLQRLGPHTGWVQDVLYMPQTRRLHSLGCNCIETWQQGEERQQQSTGSSDKQLWMHWKKSSIENSPTLGATLSSDLLCLCPLDRDSSSLFVAGGVDGRLHLWDSSTDMEKPVSSIAAHEGRVNALCVIGSLLFSASHDGTIKWWQVPSSDDKPSAVLLPLSPVASVSVANDESNVRVTCVCASAQPGVMFGTNKGRIGWVEYDSAMTSSIVEEIPGHPVVHALCCVNDLVVAGHAHGLSVFEFRTVGGG